MLAGPAWAGSSCGFSGYSYAGLQGSKHASGIAATLTSVSAPSVRSGHVAAWIGVGGAGLGPAGTDEWLQAGLSAFPDGHSELYYEVALPGQEPRYVTIETVATSGAARRVAVIEDARRAGTWRVWVDGAAVTAPIALPASHGKWAPVATAESWDGGIPTCNLYSYRFASVRYTAGSAGWQRLGGIVQQDPGYRVQSGANGFLASART